MFTTTDPVMQDWSSYAYCSNNPILNIDPDGWENKAIVEGNKKAKALQDAWDDYGLSETDFGVKSEVDKAVSSGSSFGAVHGANVAGMLRYNNPSASMNSEQFALLTGFSGRELNWIANPGAVLNETFRMVAGGGNYQPYSLIEARDLYVNQSVSGGYNTPSGSGGGPMVSFAAGLGAKTLGFGLTLSSGNEGYYLSLSGGQITGLSLVAGWGFSDPSAGITTEATISGGCGVGGSLSAVNDLSGNSISLSPNIAGGLGVGFSTGLTATTTFQIYSQPPPAATQRINPNSWVAPDRTRTRR